jgi:hypothetical protein
MDKSYWLGRKRASVANAAGAETAEARLIHLDLAGRYSIKAAAAGGALAAARQVADAPYYERLEIGARWLAEGAVADDRDRHLEMADRYARLGRATARGGR